MYEIILDQIIDDMQSFGIIDMIIISEDYHASMTNKEIAHLDSFLTDGIKWLITTEKKGYFSFVYSHEPIEFEDQESFNWWD